MHTTEFKGPTPPPPASLVDTTEVDGDEFEAEDEAPQPANQQWRMTHTPQPKGTHPGMPMSPAKLAETIPAESFERPKSLKEAYECSWKAFREWQRTSWIKNPVARETESIKAWRKWRIFGGYYFEMQQGASLINNSAQQVSFRIKAESTPEGQRQKWYYIALNSHFEMQNLLQAFDESHAENAALKYKIAGLEFDIDQLRQNILASVDQRIEEGLAGFDGAIDSEAAPKSTVGKIIGAVFGTPQK
jgi:hypothetical protein